jgi:hypothetical protein
MMETAKVDLRKLQLLNDRINQTIDALSQLRLTVHGLGHSTGNLPAFTQGATGYGFGYSPDPRMLAGYGVGMGIGVPQFPTATPWGVSQFGPQIPWTAQGINGFTHSSEATLDPYASVRIAQTFPYLYSPIPVSVF